MYKIAGLIGDSTATAISDRYAELNVRGNGDPARLIRSFILNAEAKMDIIRMTP
jgi:hypothetical protein